MDWLDLLTLEQATDHPFLVVGLLVALVLWLVSFSRKKILQDLEILERLEKIDPQNQARPAVRASLALWVSFTYGWPLLGGILCLILAAFLALIAFVTGWIAWSNHSGSIAMAAGLSLLECGVFAFWGLLQLRRLKDSHFASLMKWKP